MATFVSNDPPPRSFHDYFDLSTVSELFGRVQNFTSRSTHTTLMILSLAAAPACLTGSRQGDCKSMPEDAENFFRRKLKCERKLYIPVVVPCDPHRGLRSQANLVKHGLLLCMHML